MRSSTNLFPSVLVATAGFAVAVPACAQPFFQGLGNLSNAPFPSSHANGISADGLVVVGGSSTSASFGTEAFWWTAQTGMVGLGFLPGGDTSAAHATSFDGSIVVGGANGPCNEAFRWTLSDPNTGQGDMVGLGDLSGGPCNATAFGVSDSGAVIVGLASPGSPPNEAFHWTDPLGAGAGMVGLGSLPGGNKSWARAVSNDGLATVGFSTVGTETLAFRWTSGLGMTSLGDLPGGATYSASNAVSFDGIVVVGVSASASGNEAFRWALTNSPTGEGLMIGLGDLPGGSFGSEALAVSSDGPIVVGYSQTASGEQAFIWDETNGMRNLADVLVSSFGLDLTGWTLARAVGLSANGRTIVGQGVSPAGHNEAWIAHLGDNPCYADCDATTGIGVLDIFDFLCFQSSFVAGTSYACDCNTTTGLLVCDVFDFLCFQDAFVSGCP